MAGSPPPTVTMEEAPSDASFFLGLSPVLEPHGSGSAIQTPHPLDDVYPGKAPSQDQASAKSLGGFTSERSGPVPTIAEVSAKSIKSLSSELSEASLEERYYKLKVNFILKNGVQSSGQTEPLKLSLSGGLSGSEDGSGPSGISSPSVQTSPGSVPQPLPVAQGYRHTNDINKILQESKVDVFRLKGPMTESQLHDVLRMNGTWKADKSMSDNYESLCQVMELGWVFRKGLENSDTLVFCCSRTEFKSVAKVVGLVNLTERRPWDETVINHRRRDLRRGSAKCWVERYDGGIILRLDWESPLPGTIYEFIELTEDGSAMVLRQELYRSDIDKTSVVRMVFRRTG